MRRTFKMTAMKKIWNYLIVALAGLSLLACNKEMTEPSASSEYTYVITVDEGSKLYLDGNHMAWEEYDGVGWCAFSGSQGFKYSGYAAINMSTPRTFSVTCPISIDAGGHIYACAPCSYINDDAEADLFIPFDQYGVIQNAMPMVALPVAVTERIPANTPRVVGQAQFIYLGAVIQYNVFTSDPSYSTEQIQSVSFIAESPIAGNFSVDLTTVSETSIPVPSGLTDKSVTSYLDHPEVAGGSKADGLKVYQVVAPGTLSGTVTVTTDAATYSYAVSNVVFDRASIKTLNVDLASANATRRTLADYETLLTAQEWQLVSVTDSEGTEVTQNAGDVLTLNADYSLSVTCNTLEDNVYDYMNNEWVDFRLGYSSWDDVSREWSLNSIYGGFPVLGFTEYAYPLAIVTDYNYSQEYYVVSLTNTSLVLQYGQPCLYTITFSAPGGPEPADPEDLLKAHEWELVSVQCRYPQYETEFWDNTQTAGNKITFNADHSFSFDCEANGGQVYDYYDGGYMMDPYFFGGEEWSVSESNDTYFLDFTEHAYPLVIVDEQMDPQSFEIAVLNDTYLELHHSTTYCDYIIAFTLPGEKSRIEGLLTAKEWELNQVTRDGVDITETAGNKMRLYADHSFSFDYSPNDGYAFDFIWDAYATPYSWGTNKWSVAFGTVTSLVFAQYSFPLVIVGDCDNSDLPYEIVSLTDSALVLEYNNTTCGEESVHGLYRISFSPAS